MRLPYLDAWDVTPCKIELYDGQNIDGTPKVAGVWEGLVNYSETAKRVQNAEGIWVALAGVIHIKGDILPGVVFREGEAQVEGQPPRRIVGYSRPRNPDGSVHHTRLELI